MSSEIALKNTLRIIALATNDSVISEFVEKTLKESKEKIVEELNGTCWGEDETDLRKNIRTTLIANHNLKSKYTII